MGQSLTNQLLKTKMAEKPFPLDSKQVLHLVAELYGLNGSLETLPSYIDLNFVLTTDERRFIVKFSHSGASAAELEAQNGAMAHLADAGIRCSLVLRARSGEKIERIDVPDGEIYFLRILTYVPGIFLSDVPDKTPAMLEEFGRLLGRMDHALTDFSHAGANRLLHWNTVEALNLREDLPRFADTRMRPVIEYFLLQFETKVQPLLPRLPMSIIHNDANDRNVLLSETDSELTVDGIIDFGDIVLTNRICELANAVPYIMADHPDPITVGRHIVRGYHQQNPLLPTEVDVLFYLICMRICISVIMAERQRQLDPENDYATSDQQRLWRLLQTFVSVNPAQVRHGFRQACGFAVVESGAAKSKKGILTARKNHIGKSLRLSYEEPLMLTQGAFQYLFDASGRTYLDCVNNVCHVGHCHPRVIKAARTQMATLNTNTRYLHPNLGEYAERLTATMPAPLTVCFFVNSGSEANDLALRLAKSHTGARDVIVLDAAYHGNLGSLIDISSYKFDGPGGAGPGRNVHVVEIPDLYRGPFKKDAPDACERYALHVDAVIQKIYLSRGSVAAFIAESLPGCGGQIVLPENYLRRVYEFVRKAGGVCIADEVQVGFGRVGSHVWGFETQGVVPDIVTLGKPIGNGHPLAAVVTTKKIADSFDKGMEYFNTFGGNPVSCAVGLAVLDVIQDEGLQEHARVVGEYLLKHLLHLREKHLLVGDVRGLGLFIGIELVQDRETLAPAGSEASRIVEKMKHRGILLSTDGPLHNVIKIKPPLVFTKENVDTLVSNLDEVLAEM